MSNAAGIYDRNMTSLDNAYLEVCIAPRFDEAGQSAVQRMLAVLAKRQDCVQDSVDAARLAVRCARPNSVIESDSVNQYNAFVGMLPKAQAEGERVYATRALNADLVNNESFKDKRAHLRSAGLSDKIQRRIFSEPK